MLHAVYRVGDMATTIDYYKKHFGMKLLRYRDIPDVRTHPAALSRDRTVLKRVVLCMMCAKPTLELSPLYCSQVLC